MPIISPKIPSGLEELMRGLAKCCIKENPENIYVFAAEYFENLLKERDGSVDQNYKKFATYKVYKKNKSSRLKREKENSNDVNDVPLNNGFIKDGNVVNFKKKDSVEEIILPEVSQQLKAEQSSISSETEINSEVKEVSVDVEGEKSEGNNDNDDDDVKNMVLDEDMANAALKIQASFRGHKVRREMKDAKLEVDEQESLMDEAWVEEAPSGDELLSDGEQQLEIEGSEVFEPQAEVKKLAENELGVCESEVEVEVELEVEAVEGVDGVEEAVTDDVDDEIANMVLDDEMAEAALKIQATFRGHKARKGMKNSSVDNTEVEQTSESLQEAEGALENPLEVDEIEIVEESKIIDDVAAETMIEEIHSDSQNPPEANESSEIEEKLLKESSMTVDEVQEPEIDVGIENEKDEIEEPSEIEKVSENVDDDSIKDVSEGPQVGTDNAIEQENANALNDEAITLDEKENEDEVLVLESTEVVDVTLIKSPTSVEAVEQSTVGDCENINENSPATDETTETTVEEKQTSDETKFERPPTIENELNSIEQTEAEDEKELMQVEETFDEVETLVKEKSGEVNELTDDLEEAKMEMENENSEVQPQKPFEIAEDANVEVNEQAPQEELNELLNESEAEKSAALSLDSIDGERMPVVEETCRKKSISLLEPDQDNLESEIIEFPIVSEANDKGKESSNNLVELPSGDVEYSQLKESFSEHNLTPNDSIDEVDNKSRDFTDEKSIDNDTPGQVSLDEDANDQLASDEQKENNVSSSSVDKMEAGEPIEAIFKTEISPIELMDEIVNECAGAVANEIFPSATEPGESNFGKSVESENAEKEVVEPRLSEEKPLAAPKSIDLTQESIQCDEEIEPIRDEILKPEGEESEIPEETSTPMDENVPTISMEEKSPSIGNDEEMPQDGEKVDEKPVEDDVLDMVLDEEMEDAALKIQAAFRGHKVRKENVTQQESDNLIEQENNKDKEESQEIESNIVIDQCSEENVEVQENDENEQQDTSADCEEIQDSETGDQEETQEEAQEEEKAEEDETAVETETNEQGEDDPDVAPEEAEASEQPNDDDDVANMVLDEEMAQAALKIQSTFRGHKTRKDMKKDETEAQTADEQPEEQKESAEELDDDIKNMVLDDEMEQAALKIQSTFRGHKTRQDMKKDEATEDENKEEEEAKEEEPVKEEEPEVSSSSEKTAKQLQDEEDIAGIVMDSEMEKTALKIQSAFRGKKAFGKKAPKDGDESSASSAGDQQSEDEIPEEDPFKQNEQSNGELKSSYDEEKGSDNSAAQYSSPEGNNQYSVERYDNCYEQEPMAVTDDINLMQGGGIFPEPSGESSQEIATGSSGDERDPDRHLSFKKVPSDKSYEIDDPITSELESVDPLNDEKVIENFDFVANKDTAEAMYYSLKKNEMEAQKLLSVEKQLTIESKPSDEEEKQTMSREKSWENLENQSLEHDNEIKEDEDEDDDDVVVGMQATKPPTSGRSKLKYGMSMDDRLLGSILSQDYSAKSRREGYPDDGFDPMLEAAMRNNNFMEKLHGISGSDEDRVVPYDDFPDGVGDEDQFDDFYNSKNIRQKMMASSISIADSDYFDMTNNKSIIDDSKIRTALETIHSTDSESTIGSAATKIPLAKRMNNIATHSMQFSSIGNAAIDRSLDEFIQSQDLRVDCFDEEMEGFCSPPPHKESEEWTDDTTIYTDSDKKLPSGGIIDIKLEQKSFLTVDERRRTLHREDAIQRNSTREDEDSSKSSVASSEKLSNRNSSTNESVVGINAPQDDTVIDTEIEVPVLDLTEKSKLTSQTQGKARMKRQHTMPVQIQSDVIRVIPKHLRKRIKSADGEKKKFSK